MAYLVCAKFVVALHFGFVVFIFLGGLLLGSQRWVAWVHVPAVIYAIFITVIDWPCPLTHLEKWFLGRAGVPIYSGEFLPHYVWSRVGLAGTEVYVAGGLIVALLAANWLPYRAFVRASAAT